MGGVGEVGVGAGGSGSAVGRACAGRSAEFDVADVGWSLAGRSNFEHRAVVVGGDRDRLLAGLDELAGGRTVGAVIRGTATPAGKNVFVFPGQGSQWLGMGIELLDTAPVFARADRRVCRSLRRIRRLVADRRPAWRPGRSGLDRVDVVQPVLFAVMVSLAELWKSVGVRPDAVIGHSQGEIAAAYVAGALSLRDAARGGHAAQQVAAALAGPGGMVSIACGADRARELLAPYGNRVSIAAVNGRSAVVVSGEVAALRGTRSASAPTWTCAPAGSTSTTPRTRPRSRRSAASSPRCWPASSRSSSRTAFFSTVTGSRLDTAGLDAEYWYRNIRQTVQFDRGGAQRLRARLPHVHRIQPASRVDRRYRGHRQRLRREADAGQSSFRPWGATTADSSGS